MKYAIICIQIIVGSVCTSLAQPVSPHDQSLFRSADEVLREISRIRQVEPRGEIRKGIKTKEEIRGYILERINEEYPPEEVAAEARLLKRLGLIPADMDLRSFTLDLLTEQIAGFYDPRTKTFFIADWIPPELQKPVMAHELVHALQDQQFDLEKFLSQADGDDDRSLAQAAVIEGEGLLVMLAYTIGPFGQDVEDLDIIELNRAQRPMVEAEYPTFAAAPFYLQEMLLFPYTYGANFVQKYTQSRGWQNLDTLYRDFPASTEQILHPEKMLQRPDEPTEVPALRPGDRDGQRLVFDNVLGEFGIFLYLRSRLGEESAAAAAEGWDGDRAALYADDCQRETLTIGTVWDTEKDAEEFFRAVQAALSEMFRGEIVWDGEEFAGPSRAFGRASQREFRIEMEGRTVTLIDRDT